MTASLLLNCSLSSYNTSVKMMEANEVHLYEYLPQCVLQWLVSILYSVLLMIVTLDHLRIGQLVDDHELP